MVDHQQPLAGGARLASHWPNADAAHWRLSRPRCSGGSLRSPGQRETSRRSGGGGRPPVLEGDDKDDVVWLLVALDDQHPPPRPEDEPQRPPTSLELPADQGKLLKDAQ